MAVTNCCKFLLHDYTFHTFISDSVTECILYALCLSQRSVVEVEWTAIHKRNIYRRGHGGKVNIVSIVVELYCSNCVLSFIVTCRLI